MDARMLNIVTGKSATAAKVLDADEMKDPFKADEIVSGESEIENIPKNTQPPAVDTKTKMVLPMLRPDEKQTILNAVQTIAGSDDDMAQDRNMVGFNKMDTMFGNAFAGGSIEDETSYWKALRMVRKYVRQLGDVSKLDAILKRGRDEAVDIDEYNEGKTQQEKTEESYDYSEYDNYLEDNSFKKFAQEK